MISIVPYITTDEQLVATKLAVSVDNLTNVSVDAIWSLYDENDEPVDNGRYSLAGGDFAAWQADAGYAVTYVMQQKSLTALN